MRKIIVWTFFLTVLCSSPLFAEIQEREVTYVAGDVTLKGYLVHDNTIAAARPGVLVVHEWWGLNDYARQRARMLAELGYATLAVDMYGDGKTAEHPDDAKAFSAQIAQDMQGVGKERFLAAMEFLRSQPMVDRDRVAAIGYCFGGGTVLQMARYGVDLKGVVSFHGGLATENPAQSGTVKAKVLVCNGAADSFVPAEQIAAFQDEMDQAGVDYRLISYEGAKHSFTNPDADRVSREFGLPIAYDATADQKSWEDMKEFLSGIFSQ